MEEQIQQNQAFGGMITASILFNTKEKSFTIEAVLKRLKDFWNIDLDKLMDGEEDEQQKDQVMIVVEGHPIMLAFNDEPMYEEEIEKLSPHANLWKNALEETKAQKSSALLVLMSEPENQRDRMSAFSKLIESILSCSDHAIGVYMQEQTLLLPKQLYVQDVQSLKENYIPVFLWIYIGVMQEDDGSLSAYSFGLDLFNKRDIEIIQSKLPYQELLDIILSVVAYVIAEDATFSPGETFGRTEEETIPIALSAGVYVRDESLKLLA